MSPVITNHSKSSTAAADRVTRVSLSLPESLLRRFDAMIREQGFESRSQAVAEVVGREVVRHEGGDENSIMTGTITLVYQHARGELKKRLAEIQFQHIEEVISSFQVLLERRHTLEVILVQGPARTLRRIAGKLTACKGVRSGELMLTSTLLPPLHHPSARNTP